MEGRLETLIQMCLDCNLSFADLSLPLVDSDALKTLLKRFNKLADKNGVIDKVVFKEEIETYFGGSDGTLNRMILLLFDRDASAGIDLREFIMTLSLVSSTKADWKGRVELAYLSADLNSDGSISRDELRAVFNTCRKVQMFAESKKTSGMDSIKMDTFQANRIRDQADAVFDAIEKSDPKAITKDELVAACEKDTGIREKILSTLVLDHTKDMFGA